jgi:predicted O-linked N-acetylglucosamine transferase (SPINDLY family)
MTLHPAGVIDANALVSTLFKRAGNGELSLADVVQVAEGMIAAGQTAVGVELYKTWIAFNADHPLQHLVSFNFSIALRQTGDTAGAINALIACLKTAPDFGPAHLNLGGAFEQCGKTDAAIRQWRSYVEAAKDITPDRVAHKLMALKHIGRVCENTERPAEAERTLWQAIELRPDKPEAAQHWIAIRQRLCVWPTLAESEHVNRRHLVDAMSPMSLACHADDPMFQLAKAYRYCRSFVGRPDLSGFVRNGVRKIVGTGERLRVGYVSSDLRDHAVGFALAEVLEWRDAARVETFAYYIGESRHNDATQDRLKKSFDHWTDLAGLTDRQAAARIVEDRVDILIDVNGYTKHARTAIFAYRPAPVIVNWCGYPGTMGSPWHNYVIADARIAPPGHAIYFSEKVLHIACNQPVDRKRAIESVKPTRAEAGLPEDAFVYASFNGMQKITARCFSRWMTILSQVPGSVLWLLSGDEEAHERLRAAAAAEQIAPERLIFAAKAPNPQHLARIALADLFLDTAPYGAHSTAADALTMGLPVLTTPGRSFASRFCGSVVAAAGLPDLVCATPDDYVRRAIAFGHDRAALAAVRDRLQAARESCALRDVPALARRLEELFWGMQAEAERGETPSPDLSNLDVYYEIGAELDLENIETLDDEAYRALYQEKLTEWQALAPIAADRRLWTSRDRQSTPATEPTE